MEEAVAALVALNVVATMILLMGVVARDESAMGAVRYAAQEAAAEAASHLAPDAEESRQEDAERRAAEAAGRAVFGVCEKVDVEMRPAPGSKPWQSRQVAVSVTCERGTRDERSARGLAWVPGG